MWFWKKSDSWNMFKPSIKIMYIPKIVKSKNYHWSEKNNKNNKLQLWCCSYHLLMVYTFYCNMAQILHSFPYYPIHEHTTIFKGVRRQCEILLKLWEYVISLLAVFNEKWTQYIGNNWKFNFKWHKKKID